MQYSSQANDLLATVATTKSKAGKNHCRKYNIATQHCANSHKNTGSKNGAAFSNRKCWQE